MILLDTNVVSETMRSAPDARVVAWLDAQAAETVYLSAVSLAELRLGVAILPDGRRKTELGLRLDAAVDLFGPRILPFDKAAAEVFAGVVSRARTSGLAIGQADGQIAATAITHGLIVATRDRGPFETAGVGLIDPWL